MDNDNKGAEAIPERELSNPRIFERSTVYKLGLLVKQELMGSKNLSEKEFMRAAKEFIYKHESEFEDLAHKDPGEDDFFDRIALPYTQEGTNVVPLTLSYRGISSTPQWDDEGKYAYGTLKTPYPGDCYAYSGETMYELEYDFASLVDDCFGFWYADHCKEMRKEGLPVDDYGTPYREIVCIANPETDYWLSQEAKRCNMQKKTIANALLAHACSRGVRLDLTGDFYEEGDFYHYQFGIFDELEFGNIKGDKATLFANDFEYPRIDLVISWTDGKTASFFDVPDDRILIETFLSAIARYRRDPAWTELSKYARKPLRGRFPRKDEEDVCRNNEGVPYTWAYKKVMITCAVELGIIPDETEGSVKKLLKQVEKPMEEDPVSANED